MTISDLHSAFHEASRGNLDAFIDLPEAPWLDAKSQIYPLDDQRGVGRAELGKDVAAMANASGGLILIGMRTEVRHGQELICSRAPVPTALVDPKRYRDIIEQHVRPPVRDLHLAWIPETDDKGFLVICIPQQQTVDKPFVVPAQDAKGRDGIAVPVRSGDGTHWREPAELQRLLALGWAANAAAQSDPRTVQQAADRATAQRLLRAIPLDAAWLKSLRHDAPFSRIPAVTARAVDATAAILTDETVEFLDVETATAQEDFAATVNDLSDQFQGLFVPQEGPETYFEIPPEWKSQDPAQYYRQLSELHRAAERVLASHRRWVNVLNAYVFLNP